jgi:tetratricopeptide (TPR) repeat protein
LQSLPNSRAAQALALFRGRRSLALASVAAAGILLAGGLATAVPSGASYVANPPASASLRPAVVPAAARAAVLSARAEIVNNRGWSMLLRGRWVEALTFFEQAAALDRSSARIANNLELARAALAADLPKRLRDESDAKWAARLNDAGVAAQILGDRSRAVAAFSQALQASGRWYSRAANNLEGASAQK